VTGSVSKQRKNRSCKMRDYKVRMTIEQWVEAQDENEAIEIAKLNFNYSDLHYAELDVEEQDNETISSRLGNA
jgi:hypothetical protein